MEESCVWSRRGGRGTASGGARTCCLTLCADGSIGLLHSTLVHRLHKLPGVPRSRPLFTFRGWLGRTPNLFQTSFSAPKHANWKRRCRRYCSATSPLTRWLVSIIFLRYASRKSSFTLRCWALLVTASHSLLGCYEAHRACHFSRTRGLGSGHQAVHALRC